MEASIGTNPTYVMKTEAFALKQCRYLQPSAFFATLWLLAVFPAFAQPSLQVHLAPPGISNEFSSTPQLSWNAGAGVNYVVQTSTNLADPNGWQGVDVASQSTAGPLKWMSPEAIRGAKYYRLVTQPALFDVQPTFINSADPNAVLYLFGQLLPSNAIAVINGHNFGMQHDSTGGSGDVWHISLTGLPPGSTISGVITVLDPVTSNVLFTLPVQSPIVYDTAMSAEQLQGPPEEPPACPAKQKEMTGHVTLFKAFDDDLTPRTAGGHAWNNRSPDMATLLMPALMKAKEKMNRTKSAVGHHNDGNETGATLLMPALMKAKEKANQTKCASYGVQNGNETDADCNGACAATGEFRRQETDLAVPGAAMSFAWTRTYRSRTGSFTAQGPRWDFSYDVSLTQNGDGTVTLRPGNGRADTFYPTGSNTWVRNEYFCTIGDLNKDGYPDVLFADTSRWIFNPSGPASGKLAQIIDRNGNTMSLNYDSSGRLAQIVDDLGRTNTVAYDSKGRLTSVTDFSGRTVTYQYDGNGDLITVISPPVTGTPTGNDFPGGITNHYTYTSGNADQQLNHNLATCTDGNGQIWLQVNYQPTNDPTSIDYDRVDNVVTYQSKGVVCATTHLRAFPQTTSQSNNFAIFKTICCDGAGNVSEFLYDARLRCVQELDYTGRSDPSLPVTETSNRPTGQLRVGDPAYFQTLWSWNPDSLCAQETLPDGERMQFVYERDLNPAPDARKKGDCRVVRSLAVPGGGEDLDGDGVPDIAELDWHFQYDPRFGSPARDYCVQYRESDFASRLMEEEGIYYYNHHSTPASVDKYGRVKVQFFWDRIGKNDAALLMPIDVDINTGRVRFRSSVFSAQDTDGNGGLDRTASGGGEELPKESLSFSMGRIRPRGWDGTIKGMVVPEGNGMAIKTKGTGADKNRVAPTAQWPNDGDLDFNDESVAYNFALRVTDPRGNVTTAGYDAKGNAVLLQHTGQLLDGSDSPSCSFAYNSRGQLTAVTNVPDANGYRRVDTVSYYAAGPEAGYPQSVVADANGLQLTESYQYDARGNLTRYIDPRTNDWLFTYNTLDDCVQTQTPTNITSRCTASFIYDANGNCVTDIVEYKDGEDGTTHTRPGSHYFDTLDRPVEEVFQVLPGTLITNRFDYDADDNLVTAYSPLAVSGADPNAISQFQYDERGLIFHAIATPGSGVGGTNSFNYDVNGRPILKLGPANGGVEIAGTECAYDGFGQLVSVTDPMGNVASYNYDRNGNCTLVRCYGETNDVPGGTGNILLAQSAYQYDSLDRCIQVRDVFNNPVTQSAIGKGYSLTACAYAPNSEFTSVTDDNSHTTSYSYDTACRLTGALSARRKDMMQWVYDTAGNVTSEIISNSPDGNGAAQIFTLGYSYDSRNRCVSASDNVGNTMQYVYDSFDRCVQQTDPNGVQSWFTYDDLDRCTLSVGDLNGDGIPDLVVDSSTSFTYDVNSRCVSQTDANTNTTSFGYDSLGECTSITYADGTVRRALWGLGGNLKITTDPNGTTITNTYDLNDRIVHRDIACRNVLATTTFENFAYDGLDRCVSAQNDASTSTFAYDSLGDCITTIQDGLTTSCTYDGLGNNLSMNYPSGRVVNFAYNENDDLASISSSASGGLQPTTLASYSYVGPGRVAQITRANGINTVMQWDGTVNPANASGDHGWMQLRGISHGAGGVTPVDQRRSAFDADQNQISRQQIAPVLANGLETNIFHYDFGDRMSQFSDLGSSSSHSVGWSLDKLGNRLAETNDGATGAYSMLATIPPGDFEMNRYSSTPLATLQYDTNGNLSVGGGSSSPFFYAYDYANRLAQVSTLNGLGTLTTVASYTYDALGRCVSRTAVSGSTGTSLTTVYVRRTEHCDDGNNVIEERILGTTTNRVYVCGDTPHFICFNGSTSPQYAHCDNLGNLMALTDASGNVLERYDYDAFGAPSFLAADGSPKTGGDGLAARSSDFGMSRLFRGMMWEDAIGLYRRYSDDERPMESLDIFFDPATGRTLSRSGACASGACSDYDPFAGNPWSGAGCTTAKKNPPAQQSAKFYRLVFRP